METTHEMGAPATAPHRHPENILVPTDFSSCSNRALTYALDLARLHNAKIHLLHVLDPVAGDAWSPLRYAPEASALKESPDTIIYEHLLATIRSQNTTDIRVEPTMLHGPSAASKILSYAKKEHIDLILIGSHPRHKMKRFFLGSVAKDVVNGAPCDVLIVTEPS